MTLVSGDIRFMRIFADVPWIWGRQTTVGLSKRWIFTAFGRYVFSILGNEANIII